MLGPADSQWSFALQCLFVHSLRKFSMRDWGIEQKWMSVLLALLLLYNGGCHFYLRTLHAQTVSRQAS